MHSHLLLHPQTRLNTYSLCCDFPDNILISILIYPVFSFSIFKAFYIFPSQSSHPSILNIHRFPSLSWATKVTWLAAAAAWMRQWLSDGQQGSGSGCGRWTQWTGTSFWSPLWILPLASTPSPARPPFHSSTWAVKTKTEGEAVRHFWSVSSAKIFLLLHMDCRSKSCPW